MVNKHMKKSLTSLTGEMPVKAGMNFPLLPVTATVWPSFGKQLTSAGEDVDQRGCVYTDGEIRDWCSPL